MYDNKNKYDVPHCYESNKMEYTTGKFIISLFLFLVFGSILSSLYLVFKDVDFNLNEVNNETENKLIMYEYKNVLTGHSVYSEKELMESNDYIDVKNHIILCKTENCHFAQINITSTETGTFIFFVDGDMLGLYDVSHEEVIDYFENYSFDTNIYFIEGDISQINSEFFLIIDNSKLFIYNVNDRKLSNSFTIDNVVFNPFKISSNLKYNSIAKKIFNDHLLIKSNSKYKILNYKTGKYLSNQEFDSYNCYYSSLYQCEFISDNMELTLESDPIFNTSTITINNLNNLDYNIGDYVLRYQNNILSILDSQDTEIHSYDYFDKDKFHSLLIKDDSYTQSIYLLIKNDDVENQCTARIYHFDGDFEDLISNSCDYNY